MWIKTTRITLLVAILLAMAVLAYLTAHPSLYAAHIGRLISRNLLRDTGISFACRDLDGNPLSGLRFYNVSMTRPGDDGSFAYLNCDSLDVGYDLGRLLRRDVVLDELVVYQPRFAARQGSGPPLPSETTPPGERPAMNWRVDRLAIVEGAILVSAADGTVLEEADRLSLEASAIADQDGILAQLNGLSANIPSRGIALHSARGELGWDGAVLRWSHAQARLDTTRVHGSGRFTRDAEGEVRLQFDAEVQPAILNEVLRCLDLPEGPSLQFAGKVRGELVAGTLRLEAEGAGQIDGAEFLADRFVGTVTPDGLVFEVLEGTYRGAQGRGEGGLTFADNRLSLRGRGRGADLSRPWTGQDLGWPRSDLEGSFRLEIEQNTPKKVTLSVADARGSLHDTAVDSAGVDLTWSESTGLRVERSRIRAMGVDLDLQGTLDVANNLEMVVRAHADSLGAWSQRFGIQAHGEGLDVLGRLHGPVDQASLRLGGDLALLRGYGFEGHGNRVVVEVHDLDSVGAVAGQLVVDQLRAGDRVLGSLSVDLARDVDRMVVEQLELAHGDTTLVAKGAVRPVSGGADIDLTGLQLRVDRHTWTLEGPAVVHVSPRLYRSDGLAIRSPTGSLSVQGSIDLDGILDLEVGVQDVDLGLLAWAGLVPDVGGLADARLSMSGTAGNPEVDLDLQVADPRYGQRQADSLRVVVLARDNALDLKELVIVSRQGRARVEGVAVLPRPDWLAQTFAGRGSWQPLWEATRLESTVDLNGVSLDTWLAAPPSGETYGLVGGHLSVRGPTLAPQIEGRVSVDGFRNQVLALPRAEASFRGQGDRIELIDGWILAPDPWLQFSGSLPLSVSAARAPAWDESAGVDFALSSPGDADLRPLGSIFPFFTRVEGNAKLDYRATGPWSSPTLSGTLEVDDGVVQIRDMLEEFREVRVRGTFVGNELRVDEVTAREGEKGQVTAQGAVPFQGMRPDDVWFDFDADRVLLLSVPYLRAIGTGQGLQLRLVRPRPDLRRVPKVTGDVLVDLAQYTGEFVEATATGDGAVLDATATPPWMAELRIRAQDQVRISNSVAEVRVQGDIDLIRDLAGLRLRGQVEVPQGRVRVGYLDFDITRGRLDFSRGTNLEPLIDITAETVVPVRGGSGIGRDLERVTVVVTGTFQEPVFRFQSESGYDEKSIINLLAGVPPEGQEGVALQDVSVHIAGNLLEDALADQLGVIDTVDISTQEAGLQEIGSTRIGVGKYLGNNLYLRFSSGLSIQERDLFLEYQISRRVLLTSELRRRLRENAAQTQFNLDLKFRLEY